MHNPDGESRSEIFNRKMQDYIHRATPEQIQAHNKKIKEHSDGIVIDPCNQSSPEYGTDESRKQLKRKIYLSDKRQGTGFTEDELFAFNFSRFEVSYLNPDCKATYQVIKEWDVTKPFGVILCGPPGGGKTHLLRAMMIAVAGPEFFCRLIQWKNFLNSLKSDWDGSEAKITRLLLCDLLVMDEIGFGSQREWGEEVMLRILDNLQERRVPLFGTTNLTLDEIAKEFDPRIFDRMRELSAFVAFENESHRERTNAKNTDIVKNLRRNKQ